MIEADAGWGKVHAAWGSRATRGEATVQQKNRHHADAAYGLPFGRLLNFFVSTELRRKVRLKPAASFAHTRGPVCACISFHSLLPSKTVRFSGLHRATE